MDPLDPPTSLSALVDMHRWHSRADEPGIARMLRRHDHPKRVDIRLLWQNTFLLSSGFGIGDKPDLGPRAKAIGTLIRDRYDVAALAELFTDSERNGLLSAWPRGQRPRAFGMGPGAMESSGLLTVVNNPNLQVTRSAEAEFENEAGEDALADKGVRFIEIFAGPGTTHMGDGRIEIFSTHLQSGGHRDVALAQVREFVNKIFPYFHRPENAAILVGDFNIRPGNPEFPQAKSALESIGFRDLWETRSNTRGDTDLGERDLALTNSICPLDPADPTLCREHGLGPRNSRRIDYAWVLEPTNEVAITIDFSRPRRVRPPDYARGGGKVGLSSDHLGLELLIRVAASR
ncbi:hypothetical protein DB30_03049 [Enhygromyxa salina]|uniref:Endonuclease/exonuclease/phosphatase domain-containing protein n=2 Tax=Enhygromyxa salina TaxID=215803 RepID=A0A0C2A2E5_9BACT|nr:hypothetical protein DB30_03049 [Enhygromyxa salina]